MYKSMRISLRQLKKAIFSIILTIAFLITVNPPIRVISQTEPTIPSPKEAEQRAEQMSAEELAQIDIDTAIRDKLRFDPRWQPIMQSVKQDLMEFKWNDGKLEHPIWEKYGNRIYPLLNYYTRSSDYTRQRYGLTGIQALGKPYTTWWLSEQLKQGGKNLGKLSFSDNIWSIIQQEFELDLARGAAKTETLNLLVGAARGEYTSQNLPEFNSYFLKVLAEYDVIEYSPEYQDPHPYRSINLTEWKNFEPLDLLENARIQELVSYFDSLPIYEQGYVLSDKLGPIKAGEISPAGKAVLKYITANESSPYQVWAIAELDRHGDSKGTELLKTFLNSDLSKISQITKFADWEGVLETSQGLYQLSEQHAYLLILGIFEKYPDSKFTQGCREFGDLRGMSYLGRSPRSQEIQARVASRSPAETAYEWQQWLNKYPHHPGEDDAMHFLARSLQTQGKTIEAMRQWLDMIVKRPGDQDAIESAWLQARVRLNVGLTVEQIKTLVEEYRTTNVFPLLQYSLAVNQARLHNYLEALKLTEGIDFNTMSPDVLGSYYYAINNSSEEVRKIQTRIQDFLIEQRSRWKSLREIQQSDTPEAQYQIASNWANPDGWENGYLPFWESYSSYSQMASSQRITLLPFLNPMICELYWVCNSDRRPESEIVDAYREASPNNIALSIYQNLIDSPDSSSEIKERSLYMVAQTLLTQWELFPTQETIAIHPPFGVSGSSQVMRFQHLQPTQEIVKNIRGDEESKYELGELSLFYHADSSLESEILSFEGGDDNNQFYSPVVRDIKLDYQQEIDKIISIFKRDFPESQYIDDLLFSSYFFSKNKAYLTEVVNNYPNSDRVPEAKFLLDRPGS